jgi:hypothetical protein
MEMISFRPRFVSLHDVPSPPLQDYLALFGVELGGLAGLPAEHGHPEDGLGAEGEVHGAVGVLSAGAGRVQEVLPVLDVVLAVLDWEGLAFLRPWRGRA